MGDLEQNNIGHDAPERLSCRGLASIADEELTQLLDRYPYYVGAWCELARRGRGEVPAVVRAFVVSTPRGCFVAPEEFRAQTSEEIIDDFICSGEHRIVPDDSLPESPIADYWPDVITDDEMVSEELAEIYLSQGLKSQAKEIYRKLSLQDTKKSIYFAELIAQIDKEEQKI